MLSKLALCKRHSCNHPAKDDEILHDGLASDTDGEFEPLCDVDGTVPQSPDSDAPSSSLNRDKDDAMSSNPTPSKGEESEQRAPVKISSDAGSQSDPETSPVTLKELRSRPRLSPDIHFDPSVLKIVVSGVMVCNLQLTCVALSTTILGRCILC